MWVSDPRIAAEFLAAPVVRRDFTHRVPGLTAAAGVEELTEWLCHRPAELDRFLAGVLERGRYDAVLCGTSAHALLERRLFVCARRMGVPSVAFCDMWWAYAERFRDDEGWTLPDRLWVIDEPMRKAAVAVDWPQPLPIDIVGSPLFGELARTRAARADSGGRAIRFISEPVSTKYPDARIDEFELADLLVSVVRGSGIDLPIVIRPHPVDSIETWRRWSFARRADGVTIETLPAEEAIKDTRLAVGISSILLAELRMCGIPTASLQPREADRNYYCLPFEELGIERIPDGDALCNWIAAPGDGAPPAAAAVHIAAVATATRSLLQLAERLEPSRAVV